MVMSRVGPPALNSVENVVLEGHTTLEAVYVDELIFLGPPVRPTPCQP